MIKPYIIFDAEPFCFGPISTTINLVNFLKEKTNISDIYDLVLLGTGTSRQLAEESKVFDHIYECNTTSQDSLAASDNIIKNATLYVSTTNPHSITYLRNSNLKVFYIDTLFWMWGELRSNFENIDKYFIQRFFNIDKQLANFGKHINNPIIVNPLISHRLHQRQEEDYVLINLGGIDTVYHKTSKFYHSFVQAIRNSELLSKVNITIAGGGATIKELSCLYSNENIKIDCFGKQDFEDLFMSCRKFISAPGLTSMHESYFVSKDVFFFPPQNYSQFLNLKYMHQGIKGIKHLNYKDIIETIDIPEYLPEEDGISLVKYLSEKMSIDSSAMHRVIREIENFIQAPKSKIELPPELSFQNSGVEEIGNEIIKTCLHKVAA